MGRGRVLEKLTLTEKLDCSATAHRLGMSVQLVRIMKSRAFAFLLATGLVIGASPALAVIGGTASQDVHGARASTLRVETSRGELCSGAVIAPELVLTAAHCLMGGGSVSVVSLDPRFRTRRHAVVAVLPHPTFVPGTTPRTQPGADLAMLRLAAPLPPDLEPVTLGGGLWQGETVTMAGFGLSVEDNKKTARRLRETRLVNAGNYTTQNTVKVAVDIEARGEKPGAGACRGDSGGPVLRGDVRSRDLVGIVSWSSGPLSSRVRRICGGFTAITPVSEYRSWISEAAAQLLATGPNFRPVEPAPQPASGYSWWFSR